MNLKQLAFVAVILGVFTSTAFAATTYPIVRLNKPKELTSVQIKTFKPNCSLYGNSGSDKLKEGIVLSSSTTSTEQKYSCSQAPLNAPMTLRLLDKCDGNYYEVTLPLNEEVVDTYSERVESVSIDVSNIKQGSNRTLVIAIGAPSC